MTPQVAVGDPVEVAADQWRTAIAACIADGFGYPDHLTAIDRIDSIEVVLLLRRAHPPSSVLLRTSVSAHDATLACACDLLPGVNWHEREAAEMFAIAFDGGGEHPPLLTDGQRPRLLKVSPLPARMQTPWPGAESARRVRVPGVNELWTEKP